MSFPKVVGRCWEWNIPIEIMVSECPGTIFNRESLLKFWSPHRNQRIFLLVSRIPRNWMRSETLDYDFRSKQRSTNPSICFRSEGPFGNYGLYIGISVIHMWTCRNFQSSQVLSWDPYAFYGRRIPWTILKAPYKLWTNESDRPMSVKCSWTRPRISKVIAINISFWQVCYM